jgi:MFS family permease
MSFGQPTPPVSWRTIALTAYGPTALVSIGTGAIVPLVALSARDLGASLGTAALIVALAGIGQLIGDLPAGALAARIGEKYALMAACAVDAVALLGAYLAGRADSLLGLGAAVFVTGLANAVFSLARQAYLTEAVPIHARARAMSTLGGVFRLGSFIGPFAGALVVSSFSIGAAYAFAAAMSLLAAVLVAFLPDVGRTRRDVSGDRPAVPQPSVLSILTRHRRVLLTLGLGVLIISAVRATRQVIIPLWAEAVGIGPAATSLIFGISAGVDLLMFYPGGAVMDRFGRVWVAVPSMIIMGLGLLLLPLTTSALTITLVACLLGFGNGISSGIVLTLGADTSPDIGRAQYLGGWRVCADLGNTLGPLIISAITAIASLMVAALVMGGLAWVGAAWLARLVPRYALPSRRSQALRAAQAEAGEP